MRLLFKNIKNINNINIIIYMYKYLLFIILGILIFILYNRYDGFSIGNQFMTTAYMNDASPPILVTTRDWKDPLIAIFDKIVKGQNFCMGTEFGACAMYMNDDGGSCQINSITGLYSSIGSKFKESDINYIRSFGTALALNTNLYLVHDYLRNRESMKKLLVENGLDTTTESVQETSFNVLKSDRLYEINTAFEGRDPLLVRYFTYDGSGSYFGHSMLMYKTTILNMRSLVSDLSSANLRADDISDFSTAKLAELKDELRESLVKYNRDHRDDNYGYVALVMDLCNGLFYFLTEADYPSTFEFINPDNTIRDTDIYNEKWNLK